MSQRKVIINLWDSCLIVFVLSCLSTGQYTEEGDRAAHSGEEGAAGGTASEERR